jgi:G3E family GTPase
MRCQQNTVKSLNADARIVETDFARVALGDILDTGLFDEKKASRHPLWFKELYNFKEHVPETVEYGVQSFVYRARPPFDPQKFSAFVNRTWTGLIRAKGHFWLATRPNWAGEFSLAGSIARVTPLGYWWAAVPQKTLVERGINDITSNPYWHELWGDRRQELVFIGVGLDEAAIRSALDACLVKTPSVKGLNLDLFRSLSDPFPRWDRVDAA